MPEDTSRASLAEMIDTVKWDYDSEGQQLSPLVSTERYFRDFPWEPESLFTASAGEAERGGDEDAVGKGELQGNEEGRAR